MNKTELFIQASLDGLAKRLVTSESESYIYKGVKIERRGGRVTIYNIATDDDRYEEISEDQYSVFYQYGFRIGTYNVCVYNYYNSLDSIAKEINKELTCRNNQKHYRSMKKERLNIMRKYSEILKLK